MTRTPATAAGPSRVPLVLALGATQTLAWASSYYLPAIIAKPVAHSLGLSPSWVFAAFSMAVLISGLTGPACGRWIDRDGGRGVLATSNLVLAAGLLLLAASTSAIVMGAAWLLIGFGMGIGLYDAAFATLSRLYGTSARSTITGISLLGGLASTIGWPLSAIGVEWIGWRETCCCWAAAHLVLALPLNLLFIPRAPALIRQGAEAVPEPHIPFDQTMGLLAVVFACTWFVAAAMGAHMPRLFEAAGATPAQAVVAAALMGPAQVVARILELAFLSRYPPLVSARFAAAAHPLGAALLGLGGAAFAPLLGILHGGGNGIMTIARGTVPLSIYGPSNYGYRLGLIGAPGRVTQALAPLAFGLMLDSYGLWALMLSGLAGATACISLLLIRLPKAATSPVHGGADVASRR